MTKKRVFSNCGHEVCKHMQPHQKKTVFEKVLEWRCEDSETHREEWDKQAKAGMRNEIIKSFRKEEMVRNGEGGRDKLGEKIEVFEQDFSLEVRESRVKNKKEAVEATVGHAQLVERKAVPKSNFHGEECRTCARMERLVGDIMPHPINIA